MGAEPDGLHIEYNHDLKVSDAFIHAFSLIRGALRDQRLLDEFSYFECQTRTHKWWFHVLGVSSLAFGAVPLVAAAIRMAIGEPIFTVVHRLGAVAELCGLISVCIVLWAWKNRHRARWCQAVFCRERLRQWHFQKFLDGRLIELLVGHEDEYGEELDRRWAELKQKLKDGPGWLGKFKRLGGHDDDLFHQLTEYRDRHVAALVFRALGVLRFEHQLQFSQIRLEEDGDWSGPSLKEQSTWSETTASVTFAGAVFVSALAFAVSSLHVFATTPLFPWEPLAVTRCLGGVALVLAVLSAASRAYRAGYTLPDEYESYEAYCDRVRELKAVFDRVSSDHEKLLQLKLLEEEAAAELRRFLRMKSRATFVS
jgi:hypothetical protein